MKKIVRLFTMLLVAMVVFTSFPVQTEAAVKINKTKATAYVGNSITLKISGTDKKVTWSTSDKKIATVSSKGKVTGKKTGTATITAKVGKKSYKCKVTVKKPYLNTTKKTIYVGSSYTLKLTGTDISSVKSSDTKVASISKKGKVTAHKAGKTTITIKGKDKKKYTCTITVKKPYLSVTKKTLKVGDKLTLKITGTTAKSWSSSNKKVATVSGKGKITAKKAGTATITCKGKDGKSYTCKVTVKAKHKHTYKEKILEEATCYSTGIVRYECKGCEYSYDKTIPIKDHEYQKKVIKPDCYNYGYTFYTCKMCKQYYEDNYTDPTGHTYKEKILVQPSCEVEGKALYTCVECGYSYEENIGEKHDYKETYIAPTCTSNGGTYLICKLCDAMCTVDYEPRLDHEYTASVVAPTCEEDGYTLHKCKTCEDSYTDAYTSELGHIYKTVITQEPTCEASGYQRNECDRCGDWERGSGVVLEEKGHTDIKMEMLNGENCGICQLCRKEMFQVEWKPVVSENNSPMVYEKNQKAHIMPGLRMDIYIDNYYGYVDCEKFSISLKDSTFTKETYPTYNINGEITGEATVHSYVNDVVEVSQDFHTNDIMVNAKEKGVTEVTLYYDGKAIGDLSINVDGYTFGEAIRRYMAGDESAADGYIYRYKVMIWDVAEVLSEATNPNMTNHEKVQALLDWMEENIDYDDSLTDYGGQKAWETLQLRQAICGGYAETMALFMDALDIPCYYLLNIPAYGEGHAWNMVKIDTGNGKGEQWYYIDPTWYDFDFVQTVDEMNAENASPGMWGLHRATDGYMLGNAYYMHDHNCAIPIDDRYISPLYE